MGANSVVNESREQAVTFSEYTADGHRIDFQPARVALPNGITIEVPLSKLGVVLRELKRIEEEC